MGLSSFYLAFFRFIDKILLKIINDNDIKYMNWLHKSVKKLIEETGNSNPITTIRERARDLVLKAYENGWEGPPFNPIELSKLLDIDILPNDSIIDARTIHIKSNNYRIEYNPFENPNRINFSIAHEIGHTLFSDCFEEIRNREHNSRVSGNWELEFLCNIAASEILLPYGSISVEANTSEMDIESLIEISKKYKASLESVFLRFTEVVDKPCGIIIGHYKDGNKIIVDYFRPSSSLDLKIRKDFLVPSNSIAYESKLPGWTARGIEEWDVFNKNKYNIYSIGLPPLKNEKDNRVGIFIIPVIDNVTNFVNKINIEYGDATKPRGVGNKIIAQIVNTYAGLGLGFGKALQKNYPVIKKNLDEWKLNKTTFKLGSTQIFEAEKGIYICQMLAQKGLFAKNDEIPLKYSSLRKCLMYLANQAIELDASIHMPQLGTGQAKGDWNLIQGMIHDEIIKKGIKVNVYMLPGTVYKSKLKSNLTLFKEESTWQNVK